MTTIKDFIVDEKLKKIESNKIYTFLEESKSAKFYDELFSETHKKDDKPELYDQTKQLAKEKNNAYGIIEKVVLFLEQELHKDAIVIEIGGGVYQARSANACNRFNNYFK